MKLFGLCSVTCWSRKLLNCSCIVGCCFFGGRRGVLCQGRWGQISHTPSIEAEILEKRYLLNVNTCTYGNWFVFQLICKNTQWLFSVHPSFTFCSWNNWGEGGGGGLPCVMSEPTPDPLIIVCAWGSSYSTVSCRARRQGSLMEIHRGGVGTGSPSRYLE